MKMIDDLISINVYVEDKKYPLEYASSYGERYPIQNIFEKILASAKPFKAGGVDYTVKGVEIYGMSAYTNPLEQVVYGDKVTLYRKGKLQ